MPTIAENLSGAIDGEVVDEILKSYVKLSTEFRKGDLDTCLSQAGKFVEHVLRAIEYLRKGKAPTEIRNAAQTVREIENDASLSESLRLLVPKVAYGMVYQIRNKRGAVHVKEIDARHIDAALCVQAASWIIAELLRLYHVDNESAIAQAMGTLVRAQIPLVEVFGDEVAVTSKVPSEIELLLLISKSEPDGLDRRALGVSSKLSAPAVTRTIQGLEKSRFVHKTRAGHFRMTGPGEKHLATHLAENGLWAPIARGV